LLCRMVRRLGLDFHASLHRSLDDELAARVMKSTPEKDMVIFSDMGSRMLEQLDAFPHKVIVIDHHSPGEGGTRAIHLNPHLFDIDGSAEASGSSFALALAVTVGEANWDSVGLALAGAIGDRQNMGGFKGYNEDLVQVAAARKQVKLERVLNLRGPTIYDAFIESPEPYFAGITGRKRETSRLLKWLGLERESEFGKLDDAGRRHLASLCALRLLRQGATPEAIDELVGARYWLYEWGMYADELSALLNSCSRQGELGTGLALALGDAQARERAEGLVKAHKEYIITHLRELEAEPPKPMKNIQHFKAEDVSYAGVLAGLGALYFFDSAKATVGMAEKDGEIHVSARAPRALVAAGLDLGRACNEAGAAAGGRGGGHNVAAGATFPVGGEEKFLEEMDRAVREQIGKASG
jgi:RecJ-like exonuclease